MDFYHAFEEVAGMDIRMPAMDGVEASKIIKENYPHIKIIFLTTFNEEEYILEGLKNGVDGYLYGLHKGINKQSLRLREFDHKTGYR